MAVDTRKIFLVGSLGLFGLASLVLNILFFVVYIRRKHLRIPARYFLANLAIVDILAVALWTSLTAVNVVQDGWTFPTELCNVQCFFMQFCAYMNMHTFLFLAFERALLIYLPSRHDEIFIGRVMVIAISALWVFDAVLAVMPVTHWGEVLYFTNQYQCNMNYDFNIRQMNFMTAMLFGIPFIFLVICFVLIFVRIKKLREKMTPEGAMIMEVNEFASGDSYAARLRKQQLRFQNAGRKRKKPTMGKKTVFTKDGYESNSESSDEDDKKNNLEAKDENEQVVIKKVYYLAKTDYLYVKTYLINTILYMALWYPFLIMTYVMVYEFDTISVTDDAVVAFVWITHATCFVKPLVYFLHNEHIRGHLLKTFRRTKYKTFGKRNRKYAENKENEDKKEENQTTTNA